MQSQCMNTFQCLTFDYHILKIYVYMGFKLYNSSILKDNNTTSLSSIQIKYFQIFDKRINKEIQISYIHNSIKLKTEHWPSKQTVIYTFSYQIDKKCWQVLVIWYFGRENHDLVLLCIILSIIFPSRLTRFWKKTYSFIHL